MRATWLRLVAGLLRPARPHLERCLRLRELHLAERGPVLDSRARAIASCEARIERARAAVLAANDGIISGEMRELEREWHTLSRPDPDGELMDLWARIAPPSWIDRKRWRDEPVARVNAAIALAADVEGVELAERAVAAFRRTLAQWSVDIGSRVRWRAFEGDHECITTLLAEQLRVARIALAAHESEPVIVARALALEQVIYEAVQIRLPRRPGLARDLGRAAFADAIFGTALLRDRPNSRGREAPNNLPGNPVEPLRTLLQAGYLLTAAGASGVTLEIPPL